MSASARINEHARGDLPEPLTPADCDLRDFPYMPLMITRLRRSKAWLMAKRQPELGFYMLNLWAAAWHDKPAASLEDDDDVLADLAMCTIEKWMKVRDKVLHGWVRCSDGRLYHPIVAEQATLAWKARGAFRDRLMKARLAKKAKQDGLSPANLSQDNSIIDAVTDLKGEVRERESEREREKIKGDSTSTPSRPVVARLKPSGSVEFDAFWAIYPRRADSSKTDALKAFTQALKVASFADIMAGLRHYAFSDDRTKQPHATTWLNGRRWVIEPDLPPPTVTKAKQSQQADFVEAMHLWDRDEQPPIIDEQGRIVT